jgi:tight adherence protein C
VVVLVQGAAFVACFVSMFLLFFSLLERRVLSPAKRVRTYLVQHGQVVETVEEEIPAFRDRVWLPLLGRLGVVVQKLTPKGLERKVEKELALAGHPFGMTAREFIGWTALLVGLGLLGGGVLAAALGGGFLAFLVVVMFVAVPLLLPRAMVRTRIRERQTAIKRGLPDTLDLLTVSVEAGLGFDQALGKVVEKTSGPLAEEFRLTMQEIQMGKARRDALKDLGERTGVESMVTFVNSLVQADKLGVGIGNVLRVQSEDMRSRRRQEAEEKAMKAPIKMLFPLIFFIFPSLFVIILGPAVIQLLRMFVSM